MMLSETTRLKITSSVDDMAPDLRRPSWFLRSQTRPIRITKSTELLLEAMPRCGNTRLALVAEIRAPWLRIAHHMHSTSALKLAARWGVPSVMVIRRPIDVVASWTVRHPDVEIAQALKSYTSYAERTAAIAGAYSSLVTVAPFDQVLKDPVSVLESAKLRDDHRAVNGGPLTDEEEERVARYTKLLEADPTRVSLPSEKRAAALSERREIIRTDHSQSYGQAEAMFNALTELVGR